MRNQFFPPPGVSAEAAFHVLIVEDSRPNARIMQNFIRNYLNDKEIAHHINIAENGQLALDAVELMLKEKNRNYQLIILDNEMPVMKGEVAAPLIRELETKHQIPLDEKTYLATWSTSRESPFEGSERQIKKPIDKQELSEMLNHVLSLKLKPNHQPPAIKRRSSDE